MPVSKQRKNHKKKSLARTNDMKNHAKRISKKFIEKYNQILEAKKQSQTPKTEE